MFFNLQLVKHSYIKNDLNHTHKTVSLFCCIRTIDITIGSHLFLDTHEAQSYHPDHFTWYGQTYGYFCLITRLDIRDQYVWLVHLFPDLLVKFAGYFTIKFDVKILHLCVLFLQLHKRVSDMDESVDWWKCNSGIYFSRQHVCR